MRAIEVVEKAAAATPIRPRPRAVVRAPRRAIQRRDHLRRHLRPPPERQARVLNLLSQPRQMIVQVVRRDDAETPRAGRDQTNPHHDA